MGVLATRVEAFSTGRARVALWRVAVLSREGMTSPGEQWATVTYELVIPDMADFAKGLVSVTSPIGKALVGHRTGESVTIRTPASTRMYEIVKLATVHDREDR